MTRAPTFQLSTFLELCQLARNPNYIAIHDYTSTRVVIHPLLEMMLCIFAVGILKLNTNSRASLLMKYTAVTPLVFAQSLNTLGS